MIGTSPDAVNLCAPTTPIGASGAAIAQQIAGSWGQVLLRKT